MNQFTLQELNHEVDLPEINSWSIRYNETPGFESIKKYILEDNTYISLAEVIDTNHDKVEIGKDEKHVAFTIKNNNSDIMGFLLAAVIDIGSKDSTLLIKYIVINPEHQKHGLGNRVLKELINNHKKYFNTEIYNVFSRVDRTNVNSRNLYTRLGFKLLPANDIFLSATKKLPNKRKDEEENNDKQ